ncbi:Uncharacterized protein dnm_065600 [Desulfonema magnum]|uniref:Uncharacterized protein n=1 Tax=Desulfonema magnum TaxID=45655 RepID=A0A975BRH2_9BACT|nr:Uncharacterized protein dnm_065600 [Desulfonema magnum]
MISKLQEGQRFRQSDAREMLVGKPGWFDETGFSSEAMNKQILLLFQTVCDDKYQTINFLISARKRNPAFFPG